jgi:hypothetical protein
MRCACDCEPEHPEYPEHALSHHTLSLILAPCAPGYSFLLPDQAISGDSNSVPSGDGEGYG